MTRLDAAFAHIAQVRAEEEASKDRQGQRNQRGRPSTLPSTGVYVIAETGSSFLKIGRARDPWARRMQLQCGNPRTLVLRYFGIIEDPVGVEREILLHFAARAAAAKEWFEVPYEHALDVVKICAPALWEPLESKTVNGALFEIGWKPRH